MNRWRTDNTEGFSESELAILNSAQVELETRHPNIGPKNIADALNNAWVEGSTVALLLSRVPFR